MQPTTPPASTDTVTVVLWILIVLAILATVLLLWWTLRKARKTAVTKTSPDAAPVYRNAGIPFSFSRAIHFLKARAAGRDYRYQMPWILMLGGCRNGNSTVLANAGVSTPLDGQGGPGFGLTHGLEWWFYQQGLVLNPPSYMVLGEDGRTSDDNGFDLFLLWLLRKRPRRPLDGVVVTVTADDLLDHRGRADLITKASVLRHKLSLIRRRTSMRTPVYVLVTKCDRTPGFAAFASELAAPNDMFGWSNPYPFDAAFSPDWVIQGFEEMGVAIAEQQMDVFVERAPVQDSDGVFLFPGQFQTLCEPLRTFLAQLLQDNAYEESFFFRGFYFCGDATPAAVSAPVEEPMAVAAAAGSHSSVPSLDVATVAHNAIPVENDRVPVFLRDLFASKIFPESHLARPLTRIDMSRNRTVRTAQILTALFIAVATIGTLWGTLRLRGLKQDAIQPMLQSLLTQTPGSGGAMLRPVTASGAGDTATSVMRDVVLLSGVRIRSVFIPASWDLSFDEELVDGVALAFQDIVLSGFRRQLDNRLQTIIAASTPAGDTGDESTSFDTPDAVPQYQAWTRYVEQLQALEAAARRYNRVASPGQGNSQDFRDLVAYVRFSGSVPEGFDFANSYFDRILAKSSNTQFEFQQAPAAQEKAAKLIAGFFDNWYGPRNRMRIEVDNIAADITTMTQQSANLPYSELNDLATDIGTAEDDLRNPVFAWVSREQSPADLSAVFAKAFGSTVWLGGMNAARDVDEPAAKAFAQARQALLTQSTPLTGPILNAKVVPAELSSKVLTLRENISYLLSQTFVARDPGPAMQTSAARYQWDRATLLEAQKLFDAYDRFERGSLRSMPSYMSGVVKRIAQERLEANALDLMGQAQQSVASTDPDDIDQELKDFAGCTDVFNSLLTGFSKFPNRTWMRNIETLLVNQALRMLDVLSSQIDEDNPYAVKDNAFDWWEGQQPLAPAAYEVRTADDLKQYVDQTREELAAIAQKADPLLKFVAPRQTSGASTPAEDRLKALVLDLKLYGEKRPGNSVSMLEDFIQTGMDKIGPDTGCQDSFREPVGRTDLFLTQRTWLHTNVLARCRVLSQRAYTNQIEGTFNAKLAGRFPFTAPGAEAEAAEADPAALADFLGQYDRYGKIATDSLKQGASISPPRQAALNFLGQTAQIRTLFASFLAGIEKDPAPSFNLAVGFRVNPERAIDANLVADWEFDVGQQSVQYRGKDNTAVWRFGDPIRIALRFADNSPMIPVADPNQPDLTVNQRMVSYEFSGAWSLFRLLLAHRANRGEIDMSTQKPHLLSFYIPIKRDPTLPPPAQAIAEQVRVYIQLTVIPPGGKDGVLAPMPFPSAAPDIGEAAK